MIGRPALHEAAGLLRRPHRRDVQFNIDGRRVSGAALDHDTVSASLMAVMAALNRENLQAAA